jgi:hypothetical protein
MGRGKKDKFYIELSEKHLILNQRPLITHLPAAGRPARRANLAGGDFREITQIFRVIRK